MDYDGYEDLGSDMGMGFETMGNNSWRAMFDLMDLPVSGNFSFDEYLMIMNEYSEDNHWFSPAKEIAIITCFALLSLFGLIGNGLVVFVITRRGCKQSPRNWFILNLAASDILTCAVYNPITVVRIILKNWMLGDFMCKVAPCLRTVYVFISTFTIVALAGDRYRAIISNSSRVLFRGWVPLSICFIWLASFGIATPSGFVHEVTHVKGFNSNVLIYSLCLERWGSQQSVVSYTFCVMLLQYLSPLLAIVILHFLIANFLGSRFQSRTMDEGSARRKLLRHRKNIILLTAMGISFGVAWFPLHLVQAWAIINYSFFKGKDFPLIHVVCTLLGFSSVCMNPIIYGLLNTNFRRDLIKIYKGRQPRYSVYTDCTRRSSHNGELVGLISTVPNEIGTSNCNVSKTRIVTPL